MGLGRSPSTYNGSLRTVLVLVFGFLLRTNFFLNLPKELTPLKISGFRKRIDGYTMNCNQCSDKHLRTEIAYLNRSVTLSKIRPSLQPINEFENGTYSVYLGERASLDSS